MKTQIHEHFEEAFRMDFNLSGEGVYLNPQTCDAFAKFKAGWYAGFSQADQEREESLCGD